MCAVGPLERSPPRSDDFSIQVNGYPTKRPTSSLHLRLVEGQSLFIDGRRIMMALHNNRYTELGEKRKSIRTCG